MQVASSLRRQATLQHLLNGKFARFLSVGQPALCLSPSSASFSSSAAAAPPPTPALPAFKGHFDFKAIKENAATIADNIAKRKSRGDVGKVVAAYDDYVSALQETEKLRTERNTLAKSKTMPNEERQAKGRALKEELQQLEKKLEELKSRLEAEAAQLPCSSHPAAPVGPESNAKTVAVHGSKPVFSGFTPRDHLQLGQALHLFDFEAASSIAGSGFSVLKNDGVFLEMALVNWALSRAAAAGFQPIMAPDLAQQAIVEACGFNPRDSIDPATGQSAVSQVYKLQDSSLCLIGTSEISLAGLMANKLLQNAKKSLPAKFCAVSHCFRREAGASGQRDRGLYRLHQFTKVELFAFVEPESAAGAASGGAGGDGSAASDAMLESIVSLQKSMFAELGLHFRVLDMPTEELGAAAYRKYDIEAWMPCRSEGGAAGAGVGKGAYGEVSSASSCLDYQARRLNIRYKDAATGENRFVHTLNGTACAVPRAMLALLETHQQKDGSVQIPACLQPFMGGRTVLTPKEQQM